MPSTNYHKVNHYPVHNRDTEEGGWLCRVEGKSELTGQGGVQLVAEEALPLLPSLVGLPAAIGHHSVPQPGKMAKLIISVPTGTRAGEGVK